MALQPKESDIRNAKDYLKRRLDAELGMEHYLDRRLLAAAKEIVSLAYRRNIPPTLFSFGYDPILSREVNSIIYALVDELEEYNERLALKTDKSDKDTLLPYIHRDIDGITYGQRMDNYCTRFKMELQDYIAVGLALGLSKQSLIEEVNRTYKQPYKGSILTGTEHKGQSSYSRLKTLTRYTIADTWMYADELWMQRKGAIGYLVFRGSSYPCQVCDDQTGWLHTFMDSFPLYHPNCCCYAVPIYNY